LTRKIDYAQRFYFSTPYKDLSREVTELWALLGGPVENRRNMADLILSLLDTVGTGGMGSL
jgi:hypothetical protein